MSAGTKRATRAGNYFVSNYPPYSFWSTGAVDDARAVLDRGPRPGTPLGLYLHIPFCRKRCHFCYFKVYTGANAADIQHYVDALVAEAKIHAARPYVGGRHPTFVYFGGGTPSYLSETQLTHLTDEVKKLFPWDQVEEVTFEAEPGTLSAHKLAALRALGVTRLSLGIENFSDKVLEANNRAHHAREVFAAYEKAREIGFPQINIDLIAGMLEETEENWRDTVARAVALAPDSVTIYQMEVPFNTTIAKDMRAHGESSAPVADWDTKRRWVGEAFAQLERAGYHVASAYTAVKDPSRARFVYRDRLWQGADLTGLGVSSFSHVSGVHFQNLHELPSWQEAVAAGRLPIFRALRPTDEELMIRELILQLKLGRVRTAYFRDKFGVDVRARFAAPLDELAHEGLLEQRGDEVLLTREGLLQVDSLLPGFFLPQHRTERVV